jgi:hypothetical protein
VVLEEQPPVGWFEIHAENYFGDGGWPWHSLERIRRDYPVSVHGVGLSLGSADELKREHIAKLKTVVDRIEAGLVSEHLCWTSIDGRCLNELLPLPYTEEALAHTARRATRVQELLGRRILIENISSYLQYEHSTIREPEFLAELARRSGCALLLDVTNLHISSLNHGFDASGYVDSIPSDLVHEIHLAGFTLNRWDGGEMLIDTHSRPVDEAVWSLYRSVLARVGPVPTLIEWDDDLPPLDVLVAEAAKAQQILGANGAFAA